VRKYARGEGRFAKLLNFAKLDAKLLEHIFSVLPKIDGCQVDLVNSWRYSIIVQSYVALKSLKKRNQTKGYLT
jgi:hypothetical protein